MTRCDEVVGKDIEQCSLHDNGPYGPEILIEFTDGTVFNASLRTAMTLEVKLLRKTDDEAEVLMDLLRKL